MSITFINDIIGDRVRLAIEVDYQLEHIGIFTKAELIESYTEALEQLKGDE